MPQCTAKSKRSQVQCKNPAVKGATTCRMHGGHTPRGIAAPSFIHGKYSKHVAIKFRELYETALDDPDYLVLIDEIALAEARVAQLLNRIDTGESGKHWADMQTAVKKLRWAMDHPTDPTAAQMMIDQMQELDRVIKAGKADYMVWSDVFEAIGVKSKLVEIERKRLVDAGQMLSLQQVTNLLLGITAAIKEHVTDDQALRQISMRIRQLTDNAVG